jgi:energy-converting hydrogenase A subunit D
MFDIMDAGFVLVVVLFKYLDVALFAALAGPLSTLIFILSIVKIKEVRTNRIAGGDASD